MANNTLTWFGALISIIGSFWGQEYYFSAVGGIIVAIGLLLSEDYSPQEED